MVCDSYIYKKTVKGKKEKTHEKREILINSTEMYICRINYNNKCNPFPMIGLKASPTYVR